MDPIESQRKRLLRQQTELHRQLLEPRQHDKAMQLFLVQHAMLHAGKMVQPPRRSFEDEVLDGMSEAQVRLVPPSGEHSVAWLIWHMARCEDITMNLLVRRGPQVLHQDGWLKRTRSTVRHTGNAMDRAEITRFSNAVDVEALRAYRIAVGRRTREIVADLTPAELKRKVAAESIQKVRDEEAVLEAAKEITNYWSHRTVAGLLLMPASRHNLNHLSEALELKRRLSREAQKDASARARTGTRASASRSKRAPR